MSLVLGSLEPDRPVHDFRAVVLVERHLGVFLRVEVNASVAGGLAHVVEAPYDLIWMQIELSEAVEDVFGGRSIAEVGQHHDTTWAAEIARRRPVVSSVAVLHVHRRLLSLLRSVVIAKRAQNCLNLLARDEHDRDVSGSQ